MFISGSPIHINPLKDFNTRNTNKLFIFYIIFCDENVNTDPIVDVKSKGPERREKRKEREGEGEGEDKGKEKREKKGKGKERMKEERRRR